MTWLQYPISAVGIPFVPDLHYFLPSKDISVAMCWSRVSSRLKLGLGQWFLWICFFDGRCWRGCPFYKSPRKQSINMSYVFVVPLVFQAVWGELFPFLSATMVLVLNTVLMCPRARGKSGCKIGGPESGEEREKEKRMNAIQNCDTRGKISNGGDTTTHPHPSREWWVQCFVGLSTPFYLFLFFFWAPDIEHKVCYQSRNLCRTKTTRSMSHSITPTIGENRLISKQFGRVGWVVCGTRQTGTRPTWMWESEWVR